jgi:hypothetical protein
MPYKMGTAPRNENVVLVEDRTFGTYDVAHWSPEAGGWVRENGEPIKYTPSHWYPINYLQEADDLSSGLSEASTSVSRERRHRFFAFFLVATVLVAAALIGVAALVRQALPTLEARQSLENEPRQEVLAKEPAEARRAVDGPNLKLEAEAATAAQSLGQEREKVAALARDAAAAEKELAALTTEPARAREAVETQLALSSKRGDETAQLKQASESEMAELRQSLQQERERAEALATKLAKAREAVETQLALSSKRGDETAQFKQAAESETAELRQSLQQERDRAEALATELAKAREAVETQLALSSKRGYETAQLKQAAESEMAELRQSLQQEHDRAEALATELAKARRQKPVAVEERPGTSLPAWANNDAFVKPARTAKQLAVAPDNSKPAVKLETVPLPKPRVRAVSAAPGYSCHHNRTNDPASGTYKGYDGQRHSCP